MGKILIFSEMNFDNMRLFLKRGIELTQKVNPKILTIPIASDESENHSKPTKPDFEDTIQEDILSMKNIGGFSKKEIRDKILSSDMIYITGGNTDFLMKNMEKFQIDRYLLEAYENGTVLCGNSAGAISLFKFGITNNYGNFSLISGLGLIDAVYSPHFNKNNEQYNRKGATYNLIKQVKDKVCLAFDDGSAIEFIGDSYRAFSLNSKFKVYKCYYENDEFIQKEIGNLNEYRKLNEVIKK